MFIINNEFEIQPKTESVNPSGYYVLTPDSYAYIRAKLSNMKSNMDKGFIKKEIYNQCAAKFNKIHLSAINQFGKESLIISCQYPSDTIYGGGFNLEQSTARKEEVVISKDEYIKSFKENFDYIEVYLGVEIGYVYIVSEYTNIEGCKQLSIEDFYSLSATLALFPGAKLIDIQNKGGAANAH